MKALKQMLPKDIGVVLDAGCGEGLLLSSFESRRATVVGMDLSSGTLLQGKKGHPDGLFVVGDVCSLPFKSCLFDVTVLHQVLEHIPDEKKAIREVHRILDSNGILLIAVPHAGPFSFMDPLNFRVRFSSLYGRAFARLSSRNSRESLVHKHYSLPMLESIMAPRFGIRVVSRGGLLVRPIGILLQTLLDKGTKALAMPYPYLLLRCCYWLQKMDLLFDYGPLSYDIAVVCTKTAAP